MTNLLTLKDLTSKVLEVAKKNDGTFIIDKDDYQCSVSTGNYRIFKIEKNESVTGDYTINCYYKLNGLEYLIILNSTDEVKYMDKDFFKVFDNFYNSLFDYIGDDEVNDLEPESRHTVKGTCQMFFDYLDGNENVYIHNTVEEWSQALINQSLFDPKLKLKTDCGTGSWTVTDLDNNKIMQYRNNWNGQYSFQFVVKGKMFTVKDDVCYRVNKDPDEVLVQIPFKTIEEKIEELTELV